MKKKLLAILLTCLIAITSLSACSKEKEQNDGTNDSSVSVQSTENKSDEEDVTITLAMTSPWDSLQPYNTTSAYSDAVVDLIYDRLIYMHTDGTFSPRLADSWERNDDSTAITFHLNENAVWHDGEPVTADDVVFTCRLYANPDHSVARRAMMNLFTGTDDGGVAEDVNNLGVKALDEHTVEFTLKEAYPTDFLLSLRFREIFILPEHILADVPVTELQGSDVWNNPVGSGPCIYESEVSGDRIVFKANKSYFLGEPDFDRLVLRVVDVSNLLTGMVNGEIDAVAAGSEIPLADWETAKKQENLVTESIENHSYHYMTVNTQKPYLNAKVRQAIDLSINRQRIVDDLLKGEGKLAYGPIAEMSPYFNTDLLDFKQDTEKAKTLLEEADYPFDQVLIFKVPIGNKVREQAALLIQQDLAEIGIQTEIQTADFPTHMEDLRNGDYDIGLMGSGGPVDPSQSVLDVTPGHINNFSQNTDSSLSELGQKGESMLDFDSRKDVYDEYQLLMKEQSPFIFLYYYNALLAHSNRIENVNLADYPVRNTNVYEWIIK